MVAVRLDSQMDAELTKLAVETWAQVRVITGREALVSFLEDRAAYLLALAALGRQEPRTSLSEVRRELGMNAKYSLPLLSCYS